MTRHKHRGVGYHTRDLRRKKKSQKGMPNVNTMLQNFDEGDEVHVIWNSSITSAAPFRRFVGKTGKVMRKQGSCYIVKIKDMRAAKELILHPAHMKRKKWF